MLRNLFLIGLLFVFPATQAQAAKSVYCVNCSTSLVQTLQTGISKSQLGRLIVQYKEAVKQTAYQLQMVQTQIAQYKTMTQNTLQLPAELVGEVSGTFSELAQLTSKLNTLRGDLTSLGTMFTELYPDQTSLKALAGAKPEDIARAIGQYQTHWDTWSANVDRASQATFQLSGSQLQALQSDSGRFQAYINKLLSTPEGQQQALMSGNQLAALQINETRQLRELIATNIQSDLSALEKAEKERQMEQEFWRKFTNTDDWKNLE